MAGAKAKKASSVADLCNLNALTQLRLLDWHVYPEIIRLWRPVLISGITVIEACVFSYRQSIGLSPMVSRHQLAHQPAHSPQREASCQTREMYLESLERGRTFNWLSCCVPIINHTGPVRRIRWRGIGRPRGVWFLRPLPTSDHRLHLSLDDKNSRLIADENYLLRHHNRKEQS